MGEKYDGIRFCWNSIQRVVYLFLFSFCHFFLLSSFFFLLSSLFSLLSSLVPSLLLFFLFFMMLKRYARSGMELQLLPIVLRQYPRTGFIDGEFWYAPRHLFSFFFLYIISLHFFRFVLFYFILFYFILLRFGRGEFSYTYMLYNGAVELVQWHALRYIIIIISMLRVKKEQNREE